MKYTSIVPVMVIAALPFAAIALIAAASISGVIYVDGKQKFTLNTTEKQDGQVVQKTTEYFDNSNKLVMKDITKYTAGTLETTEGTLDNYITGSSEKIVRLGAGNYRLEYRKNGASGFETEEVHEKGVTLKGSLIFEYIARNYDALAGGSEPEFRLLVPSRLETIGFELLKERTETVQGKSCLVLKLRASSWIIRQFAGDMNFWVDTQIPHAVVQFQGRITPTDEKGNALSGTVKYR